VTFFSAGAEQMLGYLAAEVVGVRSIADFIDPAQIDERRQTIDAMRTRVEPVDAETAAEVPWTATRKDGQQRRCVVRVRALPVPTQEHGLASRPDEPEEFDDYGDAAGPDQAEPGENAAPANGGYVVVAIDVTEREELAADRERLFAIQKEVTQSLIEQNNRLRELTQMKDDVVATVSHELRTPITSIRGFVELLLDASSELGESQIRMLQTIERNAEQLQRVAEDLLADPGAGRGLRVSFIGLDLHRLAEEAVHAIQTSASVAGVHVTLEPGNEVPVFGDPTRLHQLLGNLLSNAIKFSPRGGRVQVIVDSSDAYARISVHDEGPGIPPGERDQLFERFYRLASSNEAGVPGTGLGLAIAKSVAEAHEGFVDIVDTPGWSTTFRVFVPLRTAERTESSQSHRVATS
jgi:PAS domain S-box-containing protein